MINGQRADATLERRALLSCEESPARGRLIRADLDRGIPLADGRRDAVVLVETIEHLENPCASLRELARIARPGAPVIVLVGRRAVA